jgi:hypothetical protein
MVNFRSGAAMRIISEILDRATGLSLTLTTISIQPIPVALLMMRPTFLSDIRFWILFCVSISCLEAKSSPGQRITKRRVVSLGMIRRSEVLAIPFRAASSEQAMTVKKAAKNRIKANLPCKFKICFSYHPTRHLLSPFLFEAISKLGFSIEISRLKAGQEREAEGSG